MKIAVHVSPRRTSQFVGTGDINARQAERCDEIVKLLTEAGADAWVTEEPAPDLSSDFDLVFAADLEWHLSDGPLLARRTVLLQPDRDQVFELAEKYGFPAVVYYVEFDAWNRVRNNLIVRRELATPLGGTLGPGAPYVMTSEHYAAWMDTDRSPLATRLLRFLEAQPPPPVVVSADDATQHGLPAVTIRVDRTTALYPRPFPAPDLFMAMSGPPGGEQSLLVWNCSDLPSDDVEAAIRARVTHPLEVTSVDTLHIMGADRPVIGFRTGEGRSLVWWIGFVVETTAARLLVTTGAGFGQARASAKDVLSHRLLRNALATLQVE